MKRNESTADWTFPNFQNIVISLQLLKKNKIYWFEIYNEIIFTRFSVMSNFGQNI